MQELEFRQALRDEMSLVTRPRSLKETEVLDAARHALRRRRGRWAGAGSVVAVVTLAVGAMFTTTGDSSPGPGATPTTQPDDGYFVPNPDGPAPVTHATSGPRYEQSVTLLNLMLEAVPPGFDAPTGVTAPGGNDMRDRSASTRGVRGEQWWEYVAAVPVAKEGRYGRLLAAVSTPGNDQPTGQGCALATVVTGSTACQEVVVDDMPIGVVTPRPNEHGAGSQVAVYRHPDGTVVHIEQNYAVFLVADPEYPPLTELPLTPQQLAELATDPRLHLT